MFDSSLSRLADTKLSLEEIPRLDSYACVYNSKCFNDSLYKNRSTRIIGNFFKST